MRTCPGRALESSVLTLNRLYHAVHVISVRRALCLLWKRHAEVIDVSGGTYLNYDFETWQQASRVDFDDLHDAQLDAEDFVHAVNFAIRVPRVIRLLHYERVPRNVVKFSRRNVFLRDENRCQYCRQHFQMSHLSLDHVVPRSRGGCTSWENVVCACLRCNVRKGGRTPQEAGMSLSRPPYKPKRNPALLHQLDSHRYACWKDFLS